MRIIDRILGRPLAAGGKSGDQLGYEEAKIRAADPDPQVRLALAGRPDLPAEILYYLAEDTDPRVRALIAGNELAPRHADLLLARDSDPEVRAILAGKIAKLAPSLSAEAQDKLNRIAYEALEILTRDQITRVRQIIAETMKDVAKAPPDVVQRLARDAEIAVAGPILQFSPILSDSDLLEIIAQSPSHGALVAIAQRRDVRVQVSDALVASRDTGAITALLRNHSAQIREETLDRLVDGAVDVEAWHEPLVGRRSLSSGAAIKLARIVAVELLGRLKDRTDFDESTMNAIAKTVARRVEDEVAVKPSQADPLAAARAMLAAKTLTEETLSRAMAAGDREFVIAGLAVLGGVDPVLVKRVLVNRSAKGCVALAWKAGLSPAFAQELQVRLALVPAATLLAPADGRFALSEEDMSWQIELFASMTAERQG